MTIGLGSWKKLEHDIYKGWRVAAHKLGFLPTVGDSQRQCTSQVSVSTSYNILHHVCYEYDMCNHRIPPDTE